MDALIGAGALREGLAVEYARLRTVAEAAPPDTPVPTCPEWTLADLVTLALEKRPEMRYADGMQMAGDLRAVAAAMAGPTPPEPVPDGPFEKTQTFTRVEPRHNSES